jgi:catechol 2,3-dioxygenase-like lactoylglutathione lyase family enzyme
MKLTFLYQPVDDLDAAVAFYRDTLGLDESWREGKTTAAFALPGTEVELMLDIPESDGAERQAGGFFSVDDVGCFFAEHPGLEPVGEIIEIPGGKAATFLDPAGNAVRVFDQSAPAPE